MNNLFYKKSIVLVIINFLYIYFISINIYGNECLAFKEELLKTTFKNVNKDTRDDVYYSAMGIAIQRVHEDKKVDFMCRGFLLAELRKIVRGYFKKPSELELYYYRFYSEYAESQIEAEINLGKTLLFKENIQYDDLDLFAKKMHEAFKKEKIDCDNIPNTLHHIWLTHPNNPREILSADLQTVLKNKELFSKDPVKWRHIVWINDKTLIPNSTHYLEENGIEVISIQDCKNDLKLFNIITNLINVQSFGAASDILRYSILNHLGGVYADLNFLFHRGIYETVLKYDFLTQDLRNNFFASKPKHVILQKTLEKIEQISQNLDHYFDSDFGIITSTVTYTHHPFVLAILKNANINQNVDFYLDYYYAYGREEDLGPVGKDNYSSAQTWNRYLW